MQHCFVRPPEFASCDQTSLPFWCAILTLQPLLFFQEGKGKPPKARVFLFAEPLKSLEKQGKRTEEKKQQNRKTPKKQGNRKSKGLRVMVRHSPRLIPTVWGQGLGQALLQEVGWQNPSARRQKST